MKGLIDLLKKLKSEKLTIEERELFFVELDRKLKDLRDREPRKYIKLARDLTSLLRDFTEDIKRLSARSKKKK